MTIPSIEPERIPKMSRKFVLRVLKWYRPQTVRLLIAVFFILLAVAFTVAQPLILRDVVDRATAGGDFSQLAIAAALLVLLPVLSSGLNVAQNRILGTASASVTFNLRNAVYIHLQHLPYRMYVHAPPGEINARLSGDVQQTTNIIQRAFPEGLTSLLRLAGTLAVMFSLEWRLSLAAMLAVPLLGWVARKRNYAARKMAINAMQANAALGLQVAETTQPNGILSVRLFNRLQHEIERYLLLNRQVRDLEVAQNNLSANIIVLTSGIAAIGTALVYAVGGLLVLGNAFSIGTVIAFVAYLSGLYAALQILSSLPQGTAMALVGYQRIFELLDLETENLGPMRSDLPARAHGELRFENVTFQFNDEVPLRETARPWSVRLMGQSAQPSLTDNAANALENISFSLNPGQMLAIVGPSGAGKSTIFNLIPRLYDPDQGKIALDGQDLRDLPLEWLRQQISLVSQGIYIAPGTLGDNLRYARPEATDAELRSALEAANLAEWVESLPHGLETFLGQAGARLSGGERQRLAIARALLKNTPILLLDEATSHLDSINESLLQDALFRVRRERATLVIAHRLSTVHDADEILVLERGKIIERGVHKSLLAHSGLYARLYEKQFISNEKD
ncbi:MAG: ABC transporter [Chloroflexi bacterium HGW-Chloroflexi-6]|nr:MAG: ABC transporter [Chloroflexi bacterium HGW-Chloroflexi-6]